MIDVDKVVNLATDIVIKESEDSGKTYMECIDNAIEEACIRLGINKDEIYS